MLFIFFATMALASRCRMAYTACRSIFPDSLYAMHDSLGQTARSTSPSSRRFAEAGVDGVWGPIERDLDDMLGPIVHGLDWGECGHCFEWCGSLGKRVSKSNEGQLWEMCLGTYLKVSQAAQQLNDARAANPCRTPGASLLSRILETPPLHPTRALRVAPPYLDAGQKSSSAFYNWANGFVYRMSSPAAAPPLRDGFLAWAVIDPTRGRGISGGSLSFALQVTRTGHCQPGASLEFDQHWARQQLCRTILVLMSRLDEVTTSRHQWRQPTREFVMG
ncbi:hypothetical protein KC347_g273 [Hortaea werneckii]|nr:hypothetical protein KC347_g273 [Hortaea werneckii]